MESIRSPYSKIAYMNISKAYMHIIISTYKAARVSFAVFDWIIKLHIFLQEEETVRQVMDINSA